jgi:hypothetical protein
MLRLGILTRDFRVYNRLLTLLKGMNQSFDSLLPGDDLKGFDIVMTDMKIQGNNIVYTKGLDEFRLKQIVKAKDSEKIVVGIDPGPSPGIATLANNVVIDKRSIYNFREIREYVTKVRNECTYRNFIIKIGNGDRNYRNQIIRNLDDFNLLIVNEKGSSKTTKRGNDSESAINIALSNDIV